MRRDKPSPAFEPGREIAPRVTASSSGRHRPAIGALRSSEVRGGWWLYRRSPSSCSSSPVACGRVGSWNGPESRLLTSRATASLVMLSTLPGSGLPASSAAAKSAASRIRRTGSAARATRLRSAAGLRSRAFSSRRVRRSASIAVTRQKWNLLAGGRPFRRLDFQWRPSIDVPSAGLRARAWLSMRRFWWSGAGARVRR